MLICVTEENIKCGERDDPRHCPIALACKCAGLADPYVDREEIRLGDAKVPLPDIARDFIEEFDEGSYSDDSKEREDEYKAVVKPFEFEIELETGAKR